MTDNVDTPWQQGAARIERGRRPRAVRLHGCVPLSFGTARALWEDLDLDIKPGGILCRARAQRQRQDHLPEGPAGPAGTEPRHGRARRPPAWSGAAGGSATSRSRNPSPRIRPCAPATWWASASTATAGASAWARAKVEPQVDELLELVGATRLRQGAGGAALRRRAAAAARGPGPGRRPQGPAVRRAAALPRPAAPAGRQRADQQAVP